MPMPAPKGRLGADITKDAALAEIRKHHEQHTGAAPEIAAMRLMRHVDSWEEHTAIIAALNAFLADPS